MDLWQNAGMDRNSCLHISCFAFCLSGPGLNCEMDEDDDQIILLNVRKPVFLDGL